MNKTNFPNQLTLLRIVLSFALIFCLMTSGFAAKLAAVVVFAAAALTDLLDGLFARRWKIVSNFGVLMDPIADKLLVLSAFVSLAYLKLVPAWMVVLIAARELFITGFRFCAVGKGQVLAAEKAGKQKTISQMVAISIGLIYLVLAEKYAQADWLAHGRTVVWWAVFISVVLTLTSGLSFLWHNRRIIFHP